MYEVATDDFKQDHEISMAGSTFCSGEGEESQAVWTTVRKDVAKRRDKAGSDEGNGNRHRTVIFQ